MATKRMTQREKRIFAVEAVRGACINMHQDPADLDSSAAVGLLDDLTHVDPGSVVVQWYLSASDNQIDLFEKEWDLYGNGSAL